MDFLPDNFVYIKIGVPVDSAQNVFSPPRRMIRPRTIRPTQSDDSAHLVKTHGCRFGRFGPLHANSGNVRTDDSAHTVRRASHTRCVYVYFVIDFVIVLFVIVHLFMQCSILC